MCHMSRATAGKQVKPEYWQRFPFNFGSQELEELRNPGKIVMSRMSRLMCLGSRVACWKVNLGVFASHHVKATRAAPLINGTKKVREKEIN